VAVTLDTSASNVSTTNNTTVSTTMTVGSLTSGCAVVFISWENGTTVTVSSVRLDATNDSAHNFTRLNGQTSTMDGSPCGSDIWYLVSASLTSGSHTFDVTMSANTRAKFETVATFNNADPTTPLAGFVSNTDATSPTTITPTGGTATEIMIASMMNVDGAGTQTPAVSTNTTILGAVEKETAFDGAVFICGYGAGNAASLNFTYSGVVAVECQGAVVKEASSGTTRPVKMAGEWGGYAGTGGGFAG
jgi:hypothetical protein